MGSCGCGMVSFGVSWVCVWNDVIWGVMGVCVECHVGCHGCVCGMGSCGMSWVCGMVTEGCHVGVG